MKFIRTRLIYILIAVMAVLCAAAFIIAVRISVTMVEKQDQKIAAAEDTAANVPEDKAKTYRYMDFKKAQVYPVYFNGEEESELAFFTSEKKKETLNSQGDIPDKQKAASENQIEEPTKQKDASGSQKTVSDNLKAAPDSQKAAPDSQKAVSDSQDASALQKAVANVESALPVDIILNKLGFKSSLYNSDAIFKSIVDGKPLILRIGTPEATYAGLKATFATTITAARNHIMAPPELLRLLDGFRTESDTADGSLFVNYWPASMDKTLSKDILLELNDDSVQITDLSGKVLIVYGASGPGKVDDIVYNSVLQAYIVKSNGRIYYINSRNYKKPGIFNVDKDYEISADGRYLFKEDIANDSLYIYDVKSGIRKKTKDYLTRLPLQPGSQQTAYRLLGFQSGTRYMRFTFRGQSLDDTYTIIVRNRKIVVEGKGFYSPDSKRVLFLDKTNGWSEADADGTDIIRLGYPQMAGWIDNGRVLLQNEGSCSVFEIQNKNKIPVAAPWSYIGNSPDGGIFYAKGTSIYKINGKKETRVAGFPWASDYIEVDGAADAFTLLSEEEDGIFRLQGNKTMVLGQPSLFPDKEPRAAPEEALRENTAGSPDGKKLAILQNGSKYLEVGIIDYTGMTERKLTLNYPVPTDDTNPGIKTAWLDNDRLAVISPGSLWVVDTKDGIYIYKRDYDSSKIFIEGLLTGNQH